MEETANATNEEKDAKKAAFQVAQLAGRSEASRSAAWAVATATVTRFHAASATRTCGNCSIGWTPTTVRPPPLEYVWPRGEGRGETVDSVGGAGGTLDKAELGHALEKAGKMQPSEVHAALHTRTFAVRDLRLPRKLPQVEKFLSSLGSSFEPLPYYEFEDAVRRHASDQHFRDQIRRLKAKIKQLEERLTPTASPVPAPTTRPVSAATTASERVAPPATSEPSGRRAFAGPPKQISYVPPVCAMNTMRAGKQLVKWCAKYYYPPTTAPAWKESLAAPAGPASPARRAATAAGGAIHRGRRGRGEGGYAPATACTLTCLATWGAQQQPRDCASAAVRSVPDGLFARSM